MNDTNNHRHGARAAATVITGQGLKFLIQTASLVLLARLLSPTDYGLVGIVLAVVTVAIGVSDFGFSLASIQNLGITHKQKSNLFWINTGVGVICATGLAALAPTLGALTARPEVVSICYAISPIFIISAASAQYRAELTRQGDFLKLSITDAAAQFTGLLTGVAFAIGGTGYWALVWSQLSITVSTLALLAIFTSWRPGRPNASRVTDLVQFGLGTMITQVLNYISTNVPVFALGTAQATASAGLFSRAYQIFSLPIVQLAAPLTRVVLPALARRDTSASFYDYVTKAQNALSYLVLIPLGALAGSANTLIPLALGSDWSPSVPVIQILAIGGLFQIAGYSYYWIFLARRKTTIMALSEGCGRVIMIALVWVGAQHGLVSVAVAYTAGLIVTWTTTSVGFKLAGESVRQVLSASIRPLLITAVSSSILFASIIALERVFAFSEVAALIGGMAFFAIAILAAWITFRGVRTDIKAVTAALRGRLD